MVLHFSDLAFFLSSRFLQSGWASEWLSIYPRVCVCVVAVEKAAVLLLLFPLLLVFLPWHSFHNSKVTSSSGKNWAVLAFRLLSSIATNLQCVPLLWVVVMVVVRLSSSWAPFAGMNVILMRSLLTYRYTSIPCSQIPCESFAILCFTWLKREPKFR